MSVSSRRLLRRSIKTTFEQGTGGILPFVMPSPKTLRGFSRKAFGHYFSQFPVSHDDLPPDKDYYAENYLLPVVEGIGQP